MTTPIEKKVDFDSDYYAGNPVNITAAKQRALTYNFSVKAYIDEDGCLIKDEFGQSY